MMDVILRHLTPEGSKEIALDGDSLSFGRGGEADYRFDDNSLSRLHATIYRDGDNLWIVDENSTNGTFVNEERVPERGTPLENRDTIRLGNDTELQVRFAEPQTASPAAPQNRQTQSISSVSSVSSSSTSSAPKSLTSLLPIVIIGVAFFVISISAAFIIIKSVSKGDPPIVRNTDEDPSETPDDNTGQDGEPTKTKTLKPENSPVNALPGGNSSTPTPVPDGPKTPTPVPLPPGKKYLDLSPDEKTKYVESKLKKIASIVGNRASDEIPLAAVTTIQKFVTAYAGRITAPSKSGVGSGSGCKMGGKLQDTYERASKNTWFIKRAFIQENVEPQVGIYVAMIESEHCECLQSGTGPLGMFQFTTATGQRFFEKGANVFRGAGPGNPDDRCKPELAALASARYIKFLMSTFGTGPAGLPIAIAAYNSGEGMMIRNLKDALAADPRLSGDFWALIEKSDQLSKQFRDENFKYPPLFFATAIIGENPQDFGLNLQPLSTYTSK